MAVGTLQALSGAGHPGVASVDALDNVIPFIRDEAEKIASEPPKILQTTFPISVAAHRVPVIEGTPGATADLPAEVKHAILQRPSETPSARNASSGGSPQSAGAGSRPPTSNAFRSNT